MCRYVIYIYIHIICIYIYYIDIPLHPVSNAKVHLHKSDHHIYIYMYCYIPFILVVIIPYQMISFISIQIIKQPFKLRNMLIHLLFYLHGEPLSFISIDQLLKPPFQWLCLIL